MVRFFASFNGLSGPLTSNPSVLKNIFRLLDEFDIARAQKIAMIEVLYRAG
jgi:hypothetical protein